MSNPYRLTNTDCSSAQLLEPTCWTTNVHDEASRVKQVTLQDGSTVKTDYSVSVTGSVGVTKQITDRAGKKL